MRAVGDAGTSKQKGKLRKRENNQKHHVLRLEPTRALDPFTIPSEVIVIDSSNFYPRRRFSHACALVHAWFADWDIRHAGSQANQGQSGRIKARIL